jgi:HTH-type transcriptional regulator / antitoxin HipB
MNGDLIAINSIEALGKEIRRKRLDSNLTLELAAPLCGVSVKFLQGIETGKATAQVGKCIQVANMLGIKIYIEG